MVGVAWAAIGLLAATLFGSLYYLSARMDALIAGRSMGFQIEWTITPSATPADA